MAQLRHLTAAALVVALMCGAAACGSGGSSSAARPPSSASTSSTASTASSASSSSATPPSPTSAAARAVCGNPGRPPAHYDSVLVVAFENRTWASVGPSFTMPGLSYLHQLATKCTSFTRWDETDPAQNSLTQYIGQVTGARQPTTQNDCVPAPGCSTTADNIFRQARAKGLQAVNYVEGATKPCSADGNAAKHVPALYLWGDGDRAHCTEQVRPLTDLDPERLPNFAFVTPTLCNDGHDCDNRTVDAWAAAHLQPVLDSAAYRGGRVAVFVWYDEDRPVPNLWIAPTARSGPTTLAGAGYAGTLAAWEAMLSLPCLAHACGAPDMRRAANV